MIIPFAGGSDEGRSTQNNPTRSINLFVERGAKNGKASMTLVGAPGVALFATFPSGMIRMMHRVVDRCFVVAGANLYEMYPDGGYSSVLGTFQPPFRTANIASIMEFPLTVLAVTRFLCWRMVWGISIISPQMFFPRLQMRIFLQTQNRQRIWMGILLFPIAQWGFLSAPCTTD